MAKRWPANSFFWAGHMTVANRSTLAIRDSVVLRGYEWARELASTAGLTVGDIAAAEGVSASTVRAYISRARHFFFGDITPGAIQARERRWRDREQAETCAEPGCEKRPAPRVFRADGLKPGPWPIYCEEHAAGAARTARSRRNASA